MARKRSIKRLAATVLSAVMVLGTVPAAAATDNYAESSDILGGYETNFTPDDFSDIGEDFILPDIPEIDLPLYTDDEHSDDYAYRDNVDYPEEIDNAGNMADDFISPYIEPTDAAIFEAVAPIYETVDYIYQAVAPISEDVVIFNTGTREVTVDLEVSEADGYFDDYGNFVIRLQDNAFFPYEVQFRYRDVTTVEWFYTPDSTVTIGGHTFRVYSESTDSEVITQLGFWVEDTFVRVYPEAKEFKNLLLVPASLLPLEERRFEMSLEGFIPAQLTIVSMRAVFGQDTEHENEYGSETRVVWVNGRYAITGFNDTIDMSAATFTRMELIVGDADQLNPDNIRYTITITRGGTINNWLSAQLYRVNNDNARIPVTHSAATGNITVSNISRAGRPDSIFLGLNFSAAATQPPETVYVFEGEFSTPQVAMAEGTNIAGTVWNQTMTNPGAGFTVAVPTGSNQWSRRFTIVLSENGNLASQIITVTLNFAPPDTPTFGAIRHTTAGRPLLSSTISPGSTAIPAPDANGVVTFRRNIQVENIADYFYLRMSFRYNGTNVFNTAGGPITRVVRGHINNAADILAAENIADFLFSDTWNTTTGGHRTRLNEPLDFTLLDAYGDIHQFTLIFTQVAPPATPPDTPTFNAIRHDTTGRPLLATGTGTAQGTANGISVPAEGSTAIPAPDENGVVTFRRDIRGANIANYFYLRMGFRHNGNDIFNTATGPITRVIRGHTDDADEILAGENIADLLFSNTWNATTGGYRTRLNDSLDFTLLAGEEIHKFTLIFTQPNTLRGVGNAIFRPGTQGTASQAFGAPITGEDGIPTFSVTTQLNTMALHRVSMSFRYFSDFWRNANPGVNNFNPIDRVAAGNVTAAEAEDLPNIASTLFTTTGHTAVFGGEGQVFTLVDTDGAVYPFRIRLVQNNTNTPTFSAIRHTTTGRPLLQTGTGTAQGTANGISVPSPGSAAIPEPDENGVVTFRRDIRGANIANYFYLRMSFRYFNADVFYPAGGTITRVVRGHIDNAAGILAAENIADRLFPPNNIWGNTTANTNVNFRGYRTRLNQDLHFTLLAGEEIHKFTLIFTQASTVREVGNLSFIPAGAATSQAMVTGADGIPTFSMSTERNVMSEQTVSMRFRYFSDFWRIANPAGSNFNPTARVVAGNVTAAAAAGLPDISQSLFTTAGYTTVFGGEGQVFTLVDTDGAVYPFRIRLVQVYNHRIDVRGSTITNPNPRLEDANRQGEGFRWLTSQTIDDVRIFTGELFGYQLGSRHHLRLSFIYFTELFDMDTPNTPIVRAVRGHFETASAIPGDLENVAPQLFAPLNRLGYLAYFNEGQDFTMVDRYGNAHRITVRFVLRTTPEAQFTPPNPGFPDTYFRIFGAEELGTAIELDDRGDPVLNQGNPVLETQGNAYVMPSQHDTYYAMGFQTVLFISDDEENPANANSLTPVYWTPTGADVFAGHMGVAGTRIDNRVLDFSRGPQYLSVASQNGVQVRNYWVTFVPRVPTAKLFINGINDATRHNDLGQPVREIFFDNVLGMHHDIFIANIGNTELTGLNVQLRGAGGVGEAEYVVADAYWWIRPNSSIQRFDTTERNTDNIHGELDNVAKIRLLPSVPSSSGTISGELYITYNEMSEPIIIELTGIAGNPTIVTETMPDAVRYVPYSVMLQHNNMHEWNTVTWQAVNLPIWLELRPNGELYGIPANPGTYNVVVRMNNSHPAFPNIEVTFPLVVHDNDDERVLEQTTVGHHIIDLPAVIDSTEDDLEFRSGTEGIYADFLYLFLNGIMLIPVNEYGEGDYYYEEGSTIITIRGQTMRELPQGTHTVAMEFRADRNPENELRVAAQNFTLQPGSPGTGSGNNNQDNENQQPGSPGTGSGNDDQGNQNETPGSPGTGSGNDDQGNQNETPDSPGTGSGNDDQGNQNETPGGDNNDQGNESGQPDDGGADSDDNDQDDDNEQPSGPGTGGGNNNQGNGQPGGPGTGGGNNNQGNGQPGSPGTGGGNNNQGNGQPGDSGTGGGNNNQGSGQTSGAASGQASRGGTNAQAGADTQVNLTIGGVTVNATLSGDNLSMSLDAQTARDIVEAAENEVITVNLNDIAGVSSATSPATLIREMAAEELSFMLIFRQGTLLFDSNAVQSMAEQAGDSGTTIDFRSNGIDALTEAERTALQGNNYDIYRISVNADTQRITDFGTGRVFITVSYGNRNNPGVWHISESGTRTRRNVENALNGSITFATSAFSVFIIGDDAAPQVSEEAAIMQTAFVPAIITGADVMLRFAIGQAEYTHNGSTRTADAAPFIDAAYSRTMVPLRVVAEALGARVDWIEETRTVEIYLDGIMLNMPLGTALPGGMGEPMISNDRTFVPIAYVVQMLGGDVRWDGDNRAVYISK